MRRSRGEIYIGHGCLCVYSLAAFPRYCTDPDVLGGMVGGALKLCTIGRIRKLQSVHGFRRYDNIAPNAKCQRVLVLALCLLYSSDAIDRYKSTN